MRIIPIKDNDITLSIFDNETGQILGKLHNIESVDLTENTTEEEMIMNNQENFCRQTIH